MCGILGVMATTPVNQLLYDGLMVLQHRGQDAAGIATAEGNTFHLHKGPGLVRDVFRTRNMRALPGNCGIGHVRYPTAGSAYNFAEAQPFYVNSPFGLVLGHNGNLTNADTLRAELVQQGSIFQSTSDTDNPSALTMLRITIRNKAMTTRMPTKITTQPASVRSAGSARLANTMPPTVEPNSTAATIARIQATSAMISPTTPRHRPNSSDNPTMPRAR